MRKPRILMVDDESDVLAVNRLHFEEQGYEVVCAATLSAARALLAEFPPDLVLLDILLPDGSGRDFCKELRKTTTAPVIFLTCLDENEDIIRGILDGGDDYITKPYDLGELSARVMAQLRRSGLMSAGRIDLPPLSIDLTISRVTMRGEEVPLTQKEVQLLTFLVARTGREFTRDELYREVWSGDPAGSPQTVTKHISTLRRKLKLDDESPFELVATPQGRYVFSRMRFEAVR